MKLRHALAPVAYIVVSFALAAPWHFVLFHDLYESFGLYNRAAPIIPLGLMSMLLQGVTLALLYRRWYRGGSPLAEGAKFGLLVGVVFYSIAALATAGKIQVSGLGSFLAVQAAFCLLQPLAGCAAIGLAFGRLESKAP